MSLPKKVKTAYIKLEKNVVTYFNNMKRVDRFKTALFGET